MRISDWSSDVCSSDLITGKRIRAVRGCADASLHREVLALHHVAVQRDLDLVAAGREAVGLGDVELGVAGAGQVDRLAFLIDDLAVLERPRRLPGAGYAGGRVAGVGRNRGGDGVARARTGAVAGKRG